ncbi:MAG TPA: hypothetical protein VOA80_04390 [Thermoanaerobaculia bacterium]|nr:hypothetical protein [Thermoanaerobaculia bacterium]
MSDLSGHDAFVKRQSLQDVPDAQEHPNDAGDGGRDYAEALVDGGPVEGGRKRHCCVTMME